VSPTSLGSTLPIPSMSVACTADFVVSGGYGGAVSGPIQSQTRTMGATDAGIGIDTMFDMAQAGQPASFLFSVFDVDGPGPKPLDALFGETSPGVTARSWMASRDPGTATLAPDGTSASFDFEFAKAGVGPLFHVAGSLNCAGHPAR